MSELVLGQMTIPVKVQWEKENSHQELLSELVLAQMTIPLAMMDQLLDHQAEPD